MKEWFPSLLCEVVEGDAKQRQAQICWSASLGIDVLVVNYEQLRLHPELSERRWGSVIGDEHHRIKNVGAKQTKAFHKLRAEHKLLLSGTPLLNGRLEELWSPLHWAFPKKFPGDMKVYQPDWLFRRRYCIVRNGQVVGYHNVGELREALHKRSIRRRKEEVLKELPERAYSVRNVVLNKEQRSLYRQIRQDFLLWMEDGKPKRIPDLRVRMTRLKQACFSPELYGGTPTSAKLEELKLLVAEVVAAGHKAIVYSQWAKATRIISRELAEYPHSYVDGSVPTKQREAEIEAFQDPEGERLLYVGTTGANREGITLTEASYVIFTDLEWTPAYNQQAADRAHRIGQRNTVHVVELQAQDTVEQRIADLLQRKEAMNALVVDRKPNAPVSRKVIKNIADLL